MALIWKLRFKIFPYVSKFYFFQAKNELVSPSLGVRMMTLNCIPSVAVYYTNSTNIPNELLNEGFNIGKFFSKFNCKLILQDPSSNPFSNTIIEGLSSHNQIQNYVFSADKEQKINQADILLFLPGAFDTLADLLFCLEYNTKLHSKKTIIIYDFCNFYSNLLNWLEELSLINFIDNTGELFCICKNIEDLNYFFIEV